MRRVVSITLAVTLAGNPAFAAPDTTAQKKLTTAARTSGRLVPKAEAPPRVLDGILGFLKTARINLTLGGAGSGADGKSGDAGATGATGSAGSTSGSGLPNPLAGTGTGGKPAGGATGKPSAGTGQGEDGKVEIEENNNSPVADKANANANKGGGGGAPKDSGLEPIGLVYPMCVFIDQGMQGSGNAAIKGMVDMAAACGVLILPFPVATHFTMGDNENAINEAQRAACNIPPDLGTEGKGSASSFVPWPLTAGRMCGETKPEEQAKVAGCAEVRATKDDGKSRIPPDKIKNNTNGMSSGTGNIAVSIEVPKGHNAEVLSHEALGHSQMGRPNGKKMGLGIGDWDEEATGEGAAGSSAGWTEPGCAALRDNAFANTKGYLYDRNREMYFNPQDTKIYQLGVDPPLFSPRNNPPLAGPAGGPTPNGSGFPQGSAGSSSPLGGSEAIVSRPPVKTDAKPGTTTAIADNNSLTTPKPAGRHETKTGGGVTLSELRQKNPPKDEARDDSFAVVTQKPAAGAPNVFGSGGARESVRIDESASLTTAVSTVSSGGKSSGSSSGSLYGTSTGGGSGFGGGSGGGKVMIDESMTASGPTAKVEQGSPPKLFLGKGSPPSGTKPGGFESALSNDFFSNVKFDEAEKERRRQPSAERARRGIASQDDGGGRSDSAGSGGEVRSLRR